jgi:hypothetical protein
MEVVAHAGEGHFQAQIPLGPNYTINLWAIAG